MMIIELSCKGSNWRFRVRAEHRVTTEETASTAVKEKLQHTYHSEKMTNPNAIKVTVFLRTELLLPPQFHSLIYLITISFFVINERKVHNITSTEEVGVISNFSKQDKGGVLDLANFSNSTLRCPLSLFLATVYWFFSCYFPHGEGHRRLTNK